MPELCDEIPEEPTTGFCEGCNSLYAIEELAFGKLCEACFNANLFFLSHGKTAVMDEQEVLLHGRYKLMDLKADFSTPVITTVGVCLLCGAIIGSQKAHDNYHAKFTQP